MKVNIIAIVCSLVFSLLFSGCGSGQLFGPTITPTFTPTSTFTPTPTFTSTPTTPFTPTITPTLTMTTTPTSTPYPQAACNDNKPYLATWTIEQNGMLFEAFVCPNNMLIAVFHNQEFNDRITINQNALNKQEYAWKVSVDVDSDKKTGTPERSFDGIVGADYSLDIARWSNGKTKTVPFKEAFQINVWECSAKSCRVATSNADFYADSTNKVIILKGEIPGINVNSKIIFSRFYLTLDDKLTYKTDWITSKIVP